MINAIIFDLDQTLVETDSAELLRKRREWGRVYDMIPEFRLYDDMRSIFNILLENQIPIAIVSSSPRPYCQKIVKYFDIHYNVLVCYHDTRNHKPHPDPIRVGLDRLSIESDNVLALGDKDIDIIAAKSANVIAGGCLWGCTNHKNLFQSNPDIIYEQPLDLLEDIKRRIEDDSQNG